MLKHHFLSHQHQSAIRGLNSLNCCHLISLEWLCLTFDVCVWVCVQHNFGDKFFVNFFSYAAQDVWSERWWQAGPLWDGKVGVHSLCLSVFNTLQFTTNNIKSLLSSRLLPVQENFLMKFQVSLDSNTPACFKLIRTKRRPIKCKNN